jgi:hypothetical protein
MVAQTGLIGFTSTNTAEVETTKALRVTPRDVDFGSLGIYALGQTSGLMAAGLAANSPIFAARWGDATRFAVIKRVIFSAGNDVTAFTAGTFLFKLFVARGFSVADTGGTSMLPVTNENKLRTTGMGTTLFSDIRLSSTATLTAGTRTKDANPIGTIAGGIPAVAGTNMVPGVPLWEVLPGDYPLILAQNEGIVIEATVPATGTWKFGIRLNWAEVASYNA